MVRVDDMDADDRGHGRIGGDGRKVRHRARQVARLVVQHGWGDGSLGCANGGLV